MAFDTQYVITEHKLACAKKW